MMYSNEIWKVQIEKENCRISRCGDSTIQNRHGNHSRTREKGEDGLCREERGIEHEYGSSGGSNFTSRH